MIAPARTLAFDILQLTERGGYAAELLHSRSQTLGERDAALASELVLGCLRRQAQLDHLIHHYSGRAAGRLDPEIRIALRLGLYQLRYLDRIPPHAAVSESVELAKRARKRSAAGFLNAVLRKAGREPVAWPDSATEWSLPGWLWESWVQHFGAETATGVAAAFLEPPAHYLRVPAGREPDAAALGAQPSDVPGCFVLPGASAGERAAQAGFRLQDIGAQCIVPLLDLHPGSTFLDICAAPGNKTAQALEAGVDAVACDIHLSRLRALDGLGCRRVVLDAARPLPFRHRFDRILLDAPCTGTGTLGRNPEIRWRVQPGDIERLRLIQVELLANALQCLNDTGRLVYSTCSLQPEENEGVVAAALAAGGPGGRYRVCSQLRRTPGAQPGDGFYAAVITSK